MQEIKQFTIFQDDDILNSGYWLLGLVLCLVLHKKQNILETKSVLSSEKKVRRHTHFGPTERLWTKTNIMFFCNTIQLTKSINCEIINSKSSVTNLKCTHTKI